VLGAGPPDRKEGSWAASQTRWPAPAKARYIIIARLTDRLATRFRSSSPGAARSISTCIPPLQYDWPVGWSLSTVHRNNRRNENHGCDQRQSKTAHARRPALHEAIDETGPNYQKQLGTGSVNERRTCPLGSIVTCCSGNGRLVLVLPVSCYDFQGISRQLQDSQAGTGAVHIIDVTAII
jgi:hypothetical protein